jgi:MFS family permease
VILYAVRTLGMSPGLIGLWFSLGSIGAPLGALLANRTSRRFGAGHTIIGTTVLFSTSWFLVPLAPVGFPLPFLVASGVIGSLGSVMYNITQVSLRQAITPRRIQGRMNATMRFLVWGTIPLGAFTGGLVGNTFGLRTALWLGAAGQFLAIIPPLLSPVPRVRSIAAAVEEYGHIGELGTPYAQVETPEPLQT